MFVFPATVDFLTSTNGLVISNLSVRVDAVFDLTNSVSFSHKEAVECSAPPIICNLVASAFDDPDANGNYMYSGEFDGKHSYTGPSYVLFWGADIGNWIIGSNISDDPDSIYYFSDNDNPTANAWQTGRDGSGSPGTVAGCYQ
jgi:hypothetical protein